MDIRVMEYYLAVVREGNISAAAQALHISQPGLSRQMQDLEEELGVILFERGSRRIRLTEEGTILRRRAEEMVHLMQITEGEISRVHHNISGEIHIGAGESRSFHHISEIAGIQTVDIVVSLVLAIPTVSYDGHLHSPTVKYTVVAIDP